MNTPTIAPQMRGQPSVLGEHQFIGAGGKPRSIVVDMVAGTLRVSAHTNPGHVFVYCVPHVPLSTIAPLLGHLLPHLRAALPGASLGTDVSGTPTVIFDPGAEQHLEHADDLVAAFYRRWTGRPMTSTRIATCSGCGQNVFSRHNIHLGAWADEQRELTCPCGGLHRPYPSGDPRGPIRFVPGHARILSQEAGQWTAACSCGTWTCPDQDPDWRKPALAWYLHAEAPAPGAPFDTWGGGR